MKWQNWLCVGILARAVVAHAQCSAVAFDPVVLSGPVRLMAHVDTTDLLPVGPNPPVGVNTGAAPPGVSGVAMVLGSLFGNLLVSRINMTQQDAAVKRRQWAEATLKRADPSTLLYQSLTKELSSRGFLDLHVEKGGDPMDMEQPGLLRRIEEPYSLTAHLRYGWTGEGKKMAWGNMYLRLWQKGSFRPVSCREYVYVGADTVAQEEVATEGISFEQMIGDATAELASMVVLDVGSPSVLSPALQPTHLLVNLPAMGAERTMDKTALISVAQRPARWVAQGGGGSDSRWWSLPKRLVDVAADAPMKTGP